MYKPTFNVLWKNMLKKSTVSLKVHIFLFFSEAFPMQNKFSGYKQKYK